MATKDDVVLLFKDGSELTFPSAKVCVCPPTGPDEVVVEDAAKCCHRFHWIDVKCVSGGKDLEEED